MSKSKENEAITYVQLEEIKKTYMDSISNTNFKEIIENVEEKEFITLYHGTTSAYLNEILQKGILPRSVTGIDNWEHVTESMPNVTYLTNKWHYFYAVQANLAYGEREFGEGWLERLFENGIYPCYVECKIPKSLLVLDEDFIMSNFMKQKVKNSIKKQQNLLFDPMECLANYGTVGVMGSIPPKYIKSFTVLGEPEMYKYVFDEKLQYHKDWVKWQEGKGKGKLKLQDMLIREKQSDLNGTWFTKDIGANRLIGKIGVNPNTGKLSIQVRARNKYI